MTKYSGLEKLLFAAHLVVIVVSVAVAFLPKLFVG